MVWLSLYLLIFDDAQRQGTKEAARRAGLHVLRLLNEPTAAAIALWIRFRKRRHYCRLRLREAELLISLSYV